MILINSNKLINISSILFLLLPISIVLSKFFADLTVVILAISFFFFNKSFNLNNDKKFYNNIFFVLFFSLIAFSVISSLFSSNILISLKSSFLHYRFIFFSLSIGYLFTVNPEKNLKFFFYILLGMYIVFLIDGSYQFIFKKNILGYVTNPTTRVSSLFFDELVLGSYLSRLFPILFFLYFFLKIKINTYLIIYFLTHLYFVTFITGERLSFLMINIYYFLFPIYLIKTKLKRTAFVFSFISFFLIILSSSQSFNQRSSIKNITDQFTTFNYTICEETKVRVKSSEYLKNKFKQIPNCAPLITIFGVKVYNIYSVMHYNHYISAFEIFKDNILIGIGPKNYRYECNKEKYFFNEFSCSTHPHNYLLQILTETGLCGGIIFILIYISFLYLYFKEIVHLDNKNSLLKLVLLSSILVNFFPFFPSGNFFNNWNSILYTLPLGFLLGFYRFIKWK